MASKNAMSTATTNATARPLLLSLGQVPLQNLRSRKCRQRSQLRAGQKRLRGRLNLFWWTGW